MLFDTHIHLDRFAAGFDLDAARAAARAAGVSRFLVPGVERRGWPAIRALAGATEGCLAAYGLHPLAAGEWGVETRDELQLYLREAQGVAVGEIGLDRFVDVPIETQEAAFRGQLRVAVELALPVLIHCRRMPGRVLELLAEEKADRVGGIMHAFGGSWPTARQAVDLGFVLSFGGPVTYPEARRAVEVLQRLPDDAIVVETDAPDLAPHPHRGETNRPAWLVPVLDRVAEIRGWSRERAAEITTANARRVLRLGE